jgi:predicted nucleotidyltransferase component of viral defense system
LITKQEIISVATAMKILPTTVEKDYVLSWVLYGISKQPELSKWFFKGGTCLKKCYFDTYRFSEDLDFTVPKLAIYNKNAIASALAEVADIVYQMTGLNLTTREIEVEESINKNNHKTYIAKLTYLGPLNLPSRNQQRVRLDITEDEILIDAPDLRKIFHTYTDAPDAPATIRCYSINEILAEKTRAIYERQGKARDIYDVVNIYKSFKCHVDIQKARLALIEKFQFIAVPIIL